MKLTFKYCRTATAIIVALSLSACTRFDTRMKANGNFDYQDAELIAPYKTGSFSTKEARNNFEIPLLTEAQNTLGLTGSDVDIRPPTQLMAVIDGVLLATDSEQTKIWFNAFKKADNMQDKVWQLLISYLAENNIEIVNRDQSQIETGIYKQNIVFGSLLDKNTVLKESSYKLTVQQEDNGHRVAIIVDALTYQETNDGDKLNLNLVASTKQDIELRFVNDLLKYAYFKKESEQLASADKQPLTVKLGFDDNHQSAWIVENEFLETWSKLPNLFTLLNFDIVDKDKNLGYYLLKYSEPSDDYWEENNLQPFELESGEYFVQLGEVTGGTTSIVWLDEDKKPLSDQKIGELYISITNHIRGALNNSDKQTNEF